MSIARENNIEIMKMILEAITNATIDGGYDTRFDSLEIGADTDKHYHIIWNQFMNGGEYEIFKDGNTEQYFPCKTVDEVLKYVGIVQYKQEWLNYWHNTDGEPDDTIDDDDLADWIYAEMAFSYLQNDGQYKFGVDMSEDAIQWALNNMMQHIVDIKGR